MHVQYEMIPCNGFIEEVLSVDADADADADAGRIVLAKVTLLLLGGWLKMSKQKHLTDEIEIYL